MSETKHASEPPKHDVDSASPDPMKDDLEVVTQGFHWAYEGAANGIEKLRGDLQKGGEPDWVGQLLSGVLELALPAGAAAVGVRVAQKFVPATAAITHEFVKVLFEGGVGKGISAGANKLQGADRSKVVDGFVESQKAAAMQTHVENQTIWTRQGRHKIKTAAEARRLADACSEDNVRAAAEEHYVASRNAWVSYLAQSRYGASKVTGGAATKDSSNAGPTVTNMSRQEVRDDTNKHAPGFVPESAPSLARAIDGRGDEGVLYAKASLPAINVFSNQLTGTPSVQFALLNGVNSTIRDQYAGKPLAEMNIPRQIDASVEGAPDFVLSIDERGEALMPKTPQRKWLENRALVGKPENHAKSPYERYLEGTQALLRELVPSKISRGRAG